MVNAEAQGMAPKALAAKYHRHFDDVCKDGASISFFFGDADDQF
jgi:methionyl-tRNA synthetase